MDCQVKNPQPCHVPFYTAAGSYDVVFHRLFGRAALGRGISAKIAATGLDPAVTAQTLAAAERLPRLRSLLVLRDGKPLAEHGLHGGPSLATPVNIKSASKTVLSALVRIAIARAVLPGTDQRVADVLSADVPDDADPRLRVVMLGHPLSMQAGLQRTSGEYYGRGVASANWFDTPCRGHSSMNRADEGCIRPATRILSPPC